MDKKCYGCRVLVSLSDHVEVSAGSLEEAMNTISEMHNNGELLSEFLTNEYYDGYELDLESQTDISGNKIEYAFRIYVYLSAFTEVVALSKEDAIKIANEQYYNGEFMSDLMYNDYYESMNVDVEY